MNIDVQVPVTGGSLVGDYALKLGAVDVELDGLGELQELQDIISPRVSAVVREKIEQVMLGDVKNFIVREIEKRIPNIASIVT